MAELFTQVLDLKKKDVFLETKVNDNKYFSITGLPSVLSYGKHPFSITFNDPDGEPLLKDLSNIVFEITDSRGTIIFSNLIDIPELSGAGNGFIWIKKDPLRTADEIADGPAFLHVMGELGGKEIPKEWRGIYNVRTTFTYDIRKDFPNTSPLVLATPSSIQTNLNILESVEFDKSDTVFKRSFINVTLSDLETNGGKIESVELAYNEEKSKTDDFEIITAYPLTSGSFETDSQTLTSGLNPITNTTKLPTPKSFRRGTPVKFRLRFLNPAKQLAQYLDEDRQGEIVEVTSSFITFSSSPFFIEKNDNLMTGSMNIGRAVGKGFKMSGKSSAEFSTVDYKGFTSGSAGSGSGILMFSGSVKDDITDDYALGGVGLELVADSSSYFRFRTNPKELDIRANAFFIGSETTSFISGSTGKIEISSSNFHLSPAGDVIMSGDITAEAGNIGGYNLTEDKLESTFTVASDRIASGSIFSGQGDEKVGYRFYGRDDRTNFVTRQISHLSMGGKLASGTNLFSPGGLNYIDPVFDNQSQVSRGTTGVTNSFIGTNLFLDYTGGLKQTWERHDFGVTGNGDGIYETITINVKSGSADDPYRKNDRVNATGIHMGNGSALTRNTLSILAFDGTVSGSSTSTGSFGRVEASTYDLSLSSNIEFNALTVATLAISGDINSTGNIIVDGDITAKNYIVSSSVTNVIYQAVSGSTIFGDTQDDTHQFTGSLLITGSGIHLSNESGIFFRNAANNAYRKVLTLKDDNELILSASVNQDLRIITGPNSSGEGIHFSTDGGTTTELFLNDGGFVGIGTTSPGAKLEVIGNISGSSTSTGSFGELIVDSNGTFGDDVTIGGDIDLQGDIDVNGTTNLDAVDIDGAVQIDGNTAFGVDGTGVDVTLFGDTAGRKAKWDQSADQLKFYDNTKLVFGTSVAEAASDAQILFDSNNLVINMSAGNISLEGDVLLESDISGSATSTGSFGKLIVGGVEIDNANFDDGTAELISGSAISTGSFAHGFIANNLGVGTTSPVRMLDIVGAGAAIKVDSSDNAYIELDRGAASNVSQVRYLTAGSAKWYAGLTDSDATGLDGTEFFIGEGSGGASSAHFVIDGSGNVTLGSGVALEFGDANTKILGSSANNYLSFTPGGTELLRLVGTSISGSAISTGSFGAGYIDNKLGVGTVNPKAPIHIFEDNYSTAMADPITDTRLFVSDIDGGSHIGIQSKNDNSASIYFGDKSKADAGKMEWDNSTDSMTFYSGSTKMFEYGIGDAIRVYKQINTISSITTAGGVHVGSGGDPGNDNLFVDGYQYTLGGIHVGGTSDPGDDNLVVDGNVSGSATSTGSFGSLVIADKVQGDLTIGNDLFVTNRVYVGADLTLSNDGSGQLSVGFDQTYDKIRYGKDADVVHDFKGAMVEFDGDISGSSTSTGSFAHGFIADKLGIGTTSPEYQLHVNDSADTVVKIQSTGGSQSPQLWLDSAAGRDSVITFREAGSVKSRIFNDASADALTIHDGADAATMYLKGTSVGIGMVPGASNPARLELQGTDNLKLRFYNSTTFKAGLEVATTAGDMIGTSAAGDFAIRATGNMLFSAQGNTELLKLTPGNISGSAISTGSFGNVIATTFVGDGSKITGIAATAFSGNISGSSTSTGSFGMVTAGVSTAQASGKFHVKGNGAGAALGIIEDTTGNANFLIKATASNKNSILLFGDSASDEIGRIDYDHADNSMDLITNNSTAVTIDSSQNATFVGNVSGSATSTGSFGHLSIGEGLNPQHRLTVVGANNTSNDAIAGFYTNNKSIGVGIHNKGIGITGETADGSQAIDANVDFQIDSRGTGDVLINTNDGANVGIGEASPDELLHIKSSTASKPVIKIENTNADANGGGFIFLKNTTGEADNDVLGVIRFKGNNDAAEETEFATIYARSSDVSNGSEDGKIHFRTMKAGTLDDALLLESGNAEFPQANALISGSSSSTGSFGSLVVADRVQGNLNIQGTGTPTLFVRNSAASSNSTIHIGEVDTTSYGAEFRYEGNLGNLFIDNRYNHSTRPHIYFRMKTAGTAITAMTIGPAGNVGIGTVEPGELLHVKSGLSEKPVLLIENGNADAGGAALEFYKSSTVSEADNDTLGRIKFAGVDSANNKTTYASLVTKAADVTNGDEDGAYNFGLMVGGTYNNNFLNLVDNKISGSSTSTGSFGRVEVGGGNGLVAAAGIEFPATQVTSTNVNTLDDYEEGTWTPIIEFGGNAVDVAYGAQLGKYTKIGDTVFIEARLVLTNNGSSTGAALILGLPFTHSSVATTISLGIRTGVTQERNTWANVAANGTWMNLYDGQNALSNSTVTDSADIFINGSYKV